MSSLSLYTGTLKSHSSIDKLSFFLHYDYIPENIPKVYVSMENAILFVTEIPVVTPTFALDITNTRSGNDTTSTSIPGRSRPPPIAAKHILNLFIFLEDVGATRRQGIGENNQWKYCMEVFHKLREDFQNVVVSHSKKFHQVIHSALNKLVCNYGSHAKVLLSRLYIHCICDSFPVCASVHTHRIH